MDVGRREATDPYDEGPITCARLSDGHGAGRLLRHAGLQEQHDAQDGCAQHGTPVCHAPRSLQGHGGAGRGRDEG